MALLKIKPKRYEEFSKGKNFFSEDELDDIFDNYKDKYIPLIKTPYHLLTDISYIKKILKHGTFVPDLIKILPNSFKSNDKNIDLMKRMVTQKYGHQGFGYLPVKLRKNKSFVLDVLETYKKNNRSSSGIYGDTHKELKNDKDVALMAMRSGGDPSDLPNKFKENKSMLLAWLESYKSRNLPSYRLGEFKFNKIKFTENLANLLMQADPSNYEYLDAKLKNKKEFAMRCIKNDINKYDLLPKRFRLNTEIMEYVFSRNPFLCSYLRVKDILKKDFSKLNLGKKEREIIYSRCKADLENQAGIFEIAHAKDVIFKPRLASLIENSFDLSHFNKNKVLKKIDKIKSTRPINRDKVISFYNNISFELKNDIDILLKLVECGINFRKVCSDAGLELEKSLELQINKKVFIKRKYQHLQLPRKKNKLREYMISKICAEEIHRVKSGIFSRPSFDYSQLKDKEKKKVLEDSFYHINLFDIRTKLKLVKHLSRVQITKLINNEHKTFENIHFHDFAYEMFGYSFKKNTRFATRIFLDWPQKSLMRVLDLDYLMKNTSFTNFLKNVNQITVFEDDFLSLPGSVKRNKIFVLKVLEYNFKLYAHLPSALKTDKEITDWIFTVAPRLAKSLALNDFKKIDTSNLHPVSRKVIYRQYLSKSSDDIFEKALMKRKLLQIKDLKKAS